MTRILTFLTLSISTGLAGLASAQTQPATLYKAARVWTGDGQVLAPGQVLVKDGKIVAVAESVTAPQGTAVVELGDGSTLIPGLVNAYTRAGAGRDEITREITPDFEVVQTLDFRSTAFRQLQESAVTTACICPGTDNVIAGLACIVKTAGNDRDRQILNASGPLVACLCADPAERNQARQRPDSIYVRQPTNRMGVVWLLRSTFDQARQAGNYSSLLNVSQVLAGERPLMIVSRTQHDLTSVMTLADEFGFSPIVVGGHEASVVAEALATREIRVVIDALTTGALRGPEGTELCWNLAGVLANKQVPFCLAGDNLLEQARFARRFGLSESQALAAVTSGPARLLGLADRIGAIAPGRDADMIALNGDPLEFTSSIRWVMVDGRLHKPHKEN
jgi:imidazolonepropionase-like amidohydrolase